jgi:hypothetical protein
MTSLGAASIALFVGAAAAFVLYYTSSNKPESVWILAFLRFGWMAMLVYAILAPALERKQEVPRPQVLWILADTSHSVYGDAMGIAAEINNTQQGQGLQCMTIPYSSEVIPEEQPWIYVGDGHIELISSTVTAPVGMYMMPANPLDAPSLLQGVSVPQRVVAGSSFPYRVLLSQGEADLIVEWNGQKSQGAQGLLKAPEELGTYAVKVVATSGGRTDQRTVWVQVEKEYRKVGLLSDAAHPHEMMVRRWAKKRRYSMVGDRTVSNIITIGKVSAPEGKEVLKLSGGVPNAFDIAQVYKPGKSSLPNAVKLWTSEERMLDLSKVHWYRSALEDEKVIAVFEDYLDQFIARTTPPRISYSGNSSPLKGQQATWTLSLIGSDGLPKQASSSVEIWKGEELVDVPVVDESESGIYSFSTRFTSSGTFDIRMSMTRDEEDFIAHERVAVVEGDIEAVRPYNQRLMNEWRQQAQWVVSDTNTAAYDDRAMERQTMELAIKNPQHYTWWYWGLALLLAALEWVLRRRQGLI